MARTTVTLDSDVEALLAKLMKERNMSFKEAVNTSLRQALAPIDVDYDFPTFSMGQPLVDLTHAHRVVEELDDHAELQRMRVDG